MKLLVLLISGFAFISANGQQISNKINIESFYKDSIIKGNRLFNSLAINQTNYKFLFKNGKGSVYESPVDHMRCLASDFPSTMPVADLPKIDSNGNKFQPERMPNPFLNRNAIPPPIHLKNKERSQK
jgi:hypothetical protein